METKLKVVIGDGWAALGLLAKFLPESPVCWITGSQSRMSAPLPGIEPGPSLQLLRDLSAKWDIDCGPLVEGNSLREYRGKAFREPSWEKVRAGSESSAEVAEPAQSGKSAKSPSSLSPKEKLIAETLWAPEIRWVGSGLARFGLSLPEIEEKLRRSILEVLSRSSSGSPLRRIEGLPVTGVFSDAEGGLKVVLGSGEQILCSEIYYADRWSLLPGLEGMPRPVPFLRGKNPVGVLQANFVHKVPVGLGVKESFFAAIHREPGEEVDRHIWGFFFSDGMRSSWSICLAPEEVEDNHSIAKKLRRMKSTLDRVFAGSGILPQGYETFGSTLADEQVRFEEEAVFSGGHVLSTSVELADRPGLHFLTDSYGPSASLAQVAALASF